MAAVERAVAHKNGRSSRSTAGVARCRPIREGTAGTSSVEPVAAPQAQHPAGCDGTRRLQLAGVSADISAFLEAINFREGTAGMLLAGVAQQLPGLRKLWLDMGYRGALWREWLQENLPHVNAEVVQKPRRWMWVAADQEPPPMPQGFQVFPRRWVVERTFAW